MSLADFEALCAQIAADGMVPMTVGAADWYTIMHIWDICMAIVDGGPEYLKENDGAESLHERSTLRGRFPNARGLAQQRLVLCQL